MTTLVRHLSTGQKILDAGLAALAFGLSGLGAAGVGAGLLFGDVSALLLAVTVALRRWCPSAMVGFAVATGLMLLVDGSVNVGIVLVLVLLFATTGNDQSRWIRGVGLASVLVASVGAGVAAATHGFFSWPSGAGPRAGMVAAVETGVVAASAWLVGFVLYQRRLAAEARVGEQIARVELLHEQERTRIARDMHDVVAHTLAVVVAQADGARYAMKRQPELAEGTLRTIAETCRGSLDDVRRLVGELRGEPALLSGILGEDALFERMRLSGLDLEISICGDRRPLNSTQAATERWVLTEALTNALKHGAPSEPVTVRRAWGEQFELSVSNRVPATTLVHPQAFGRGHGLTGVAERVRLAGGSSEYRIEDDRFVLQVRLPLEPEGLCDHGTSRR